MTMKSIKVLSDCTKTSGNQLKSISSERDFFGIAQITSKDVAGSFKSNTKLPIQEMSSKYQPLMQKRQQLENVTIESNVVFGTVRFDKDNEPKSHGQFEKISQKLLYDTIKIKQMYTPETNEENRKIVDETIESNDIDYSCNQEIPGCKPAYKIELVQTDVTLGEALKIFRYSEKDELESSTRYLNLPPLNFFFNNATKGQEKIADYQKPSATTVEKLSGHRLSDEELEQSIEESANEIQLKPALEYDPDKDHTPFEDLDPDSEEYMIREAKKMRNLEWDDSIDDEFEEVKGVLKNSPNLNALQYLKGVRAGRVEPQSSELKKRYQDHDDNPLGFEKSFELDSQGFRNYSKQVPNWNNFRRVEILNFLKKSIVYDNYGIVALNKPYGIASHETVKNREPIDINSLMQEVAIQLKHKQLFLAHRLDKTTTGILIFATTQEKVAQLNKLFKSGEISKTYWCLVKGVPHPEAGLIDIPVGEFAVAGKVRSCLCPERLDKGKQFSKKYRVARRAITEYQVLDKSCGASLVEVKPRTGVKHQIRCHMSFGVGTPILGDHKYNRMEKVAPQQLSVPILKALNMRQPKARTLPMHLHAKSIVIPGAKANGETLFIKAPLAHHFVENMKSLKMKISG